MMTIVPDPALVHNRLFLPELRVTEQESKNNQWNTKTKTDDAENPLTFLVRRDDSLALRTVERILSNDVERTCIGSSGEGSVAKVTSTLR